MTTSLSLSNPEQCELGQPRACRRKLRHGLAMVELAMALPMFAVIFLVLLTIIVATRSALKATYSVRGMEWAHRDDVADPNAFVPAIKLKQWKNVLRIMPESNRGEALGEATTEVAAVPFEAPLPSMFDQQTVIERRHALLHDAWDSRTIQFDVDHDRLVFGNRTAEFLTVDLDSKKLVMDLDVFVKLIQDRTR